MMAKTQTECEGEPKEVYLVTFTYGNHYNFTRAYFTTRGVKSAISHHKNYRAKVRKCKLEDFEVVEV